MLDVWQAVHTWRWGEWSGAAIALVVIRWWAALGPLMSCGAGWLPAGASGVLLRLMGALLGVWLVLSCAPGLALHAPSTPLAWAGVAAMSWLVGWALGAGAVFLWEALEAGAHIVAHHAGLSAVWDGSEGGHSGGRLFALLGVIIACSTGMHVAWSGLVVRSFAWIPPASEQWRVGHEPLAQGAWPLMASGAGVPGTALALALPSVGCLALAKVLEAALERALPGMVETGELGRTLGLALVLVWGWLALEGIWLQAESALWGSLDAVSSGVDASAASRKRP